MKYIVIREFQQRGAVHYHCLFFNLPFVDDLQKIMEASWQHGFVQVKAVDRVKNLSLYLTKYMTKGMLDTTWKCKRRYFVSRGLLRPMDIREEGIGRSIIRTLNGPAIEHRIWHSDYAGAIEYMKFDLGKGRSVFDLPLDSETKAVLDAYKQSLQA